jgi:hypothetical protein
MVNLDSMLFFTGLVVEFGFLVLLIHKRTFRTLPVFCAYILWSLISDVGQYCLVQRFPEYDLHIYLVQALMGSIFMFGVLIELSMSVLRPVRSSLPRGVVVAVGIIIALVCAAIWPFTKSPGFDQLKFAASRSIVHLQMTFSAVLILFFLALTACSQWLSIGWRDRELQIATGFGLYSLVSLSASLYHMNQAVGAAALDQQYHYHLVDLMVVASYICSLTYWIVCFAQEVPERREFTPQMESFLLALAGTARTTRMALSDSHGSKTGRRGR